MAMRKVFVADVIEILEILTAAVLEEEMVINVAMVVAVIRKILESAITGGTCYLHLKGRGSQVSLA